MGSKLKNRPGGCLTSLLFLPLAVVIAFYQLLRDAARGKY